MPSMGVCDQSREGHDMALALEDRLAVSELIALHGHLVDDGELDRSDEVFTADVVYDLSIELVVPLPGFVKRRAEVRILNTVKELKARAEA